MRLDKDRRKVLAKLSAKSGYSERACLESAVDLMAMIDSGEAAVWTPAAFNAALARYAAYVLSVYAGAPLQPLVMPGGELTFVPLDTMPEAPEGATVH